MAVIEITRGASVESIHRVHVAVVHADRGLVASAGNPRFVSFVRSAIKMFQALPLAEDGVVSHFGLTEEELALCTASHNAEEFHVAAALSILGKAGAAEESLACGPHPPMDPGAASRLAERGGTPGRIHNNCSGKHAGMLALAAFHRWPADGYHLIDHPVQQRVLATLSEWSGTPAAEIAIGVDGCGLPTFALPLASVAAACARFGAAAADDVAAPRQIAAAMTNHPAFVAGTGRLCTALMQAAGGRLFAKVGAEGYYCAGVPAQRLGIALKIEDGAKRAAEPALLTVLHALDLISSDELASLESFAQPAVYNTRGEVVGHVRARIPLTSNSSPPFAVR